MLMVREIIEEIRELTLLEECAYCVMDDNTFIDEFIDDVKKDMADRGYVEIVDTKYENGYYHHIARFKKDVERPAEDYERIAYYYVKAFPNGGDCTNCNKCPFDDDCICFVSTFNKCIDIIKDKEFFEDDKDGMSN